MEEGRYFFVKTVKCAGCGNRKTFAGKGLGMIYRANSNWKLLLACSAACAAKFSNKKPVHFKKEMAAEPEKLMTRYGAIPYRNAKEGKI